jgi:membrane protease YdiL (CAAX protease family)
MARSTLPKPAPLAAPDPLLRQRGWAALTIGLLSVLGLLFLGNMQRGIYVVVMTLAFAVLAIWLGVTAARRARRGGMARPRGTVSGIAFGVLGLGLSGVILVAFAVLWPQLKAYSSCEASANTVAAQQVCQNEFSTAVNGRINLLESGR